VPILPRTIALLLATLLASPPTSDPVTRGALWHEESQSALAAANGTDNQLRVEAFSRLHSDFPESSRVLRNVAWAEQRAGNADAAVKALNDYAEMGMTLDSNGPIYKAMASLGLLAKAPRLDRNRSATTNGSKVFSLPDPDLLVEDIAFDAKAGRYLLTSVRKNKIVSCDQSGHCRDVVTSTPDNPLDGMLAIHIDARRNVVWATSSGMPMEQGYRPERKGKSALLKFDLETFRLIKRYEPGDGKEHALGDMTVASNGDAYVSDGLSGDVYVVKHDNDKLTPLVPAGVFVSPQTPALNKSESILYVPDYAEGIAAIQLATGKIQWLRTTTPLALEGIDGLYWTETGLIATQNGTSPERVVRFHFRNESVLDSFKVIEANWPGLGDPTHGVLVGNVFYFIVNSGWDRIGDDESSFRPGTAPEIWKVQID